MIKDDSKSSKGEPEALNSRLLNLTKKTSNARLHRENLEKDIDTNVSIFGIDSIGGKVSLSNSRLLQNKKLRGKSPASKSKRPKSGLKRRGSKDAKLPVNHVNKPPQNSPKAHGLKQFKKLTNSAIIRGDDSIITQERPKKSQSPIKRPPIMPGNISSA
jgi:hypothetical protein